METGSFSLGRCSNADILAAQGDCQGPGHILHGDAGEGRLFPVHGKGYLLLVILAVPVHIHHTGGFGEDIP